MSYLPDWFDPERDVVLTPSQLEGLVHPVRVRILRELRERGPSTASRLAAATGQSSGVTSYHLRVLAGHGLVVEDAERGDRRDRWWRAAHRYAAFTFREPTDPASEGTAELATQYLRLAVAALSERMLEYVETLESRREELAELPFTFADLTLRMTREEAFALRRTIEDAARPYLVGGESAPPAEGQEDMVLQLQLLPRDPREAVGP